MIDQFNEAIRAYKTKWDVFVAERKDKDFFAGLKPTSAAWKTEDFADFDKKFNELRDKSDQIHLAWINERWLGVLHLRDDIRLEWGIEIAVLMQRRPGSSDTVGLDHLDFRSPELPEVEKVLKADAGIKWSRETNGDFCEWLSVWFAGTEAKLRPYTKFDVAISEFQAINDRLK